MRTELTNPRAERVAAVRALVNQRSARQRAGRFVAEGPQAAREAVRFVPGSVRDLYVTRAAASRWPEIVDAALAGGVDVHPMTEDVHARMSEDAQGVIAVVDHAPRDLDGMDLASARLVAVCEEVRDPGNVGTIVRAADAVGADAVILTSGSVELTSPKVVRSSAGSLFHLPVATGVALADAIAALHAAGLVVLAADGGASHDLETSPHVAGRVAWILGNEAHGVTEDAATMADATVRIPMPGRAESLNVAMAATLVLYASARAHAARAEEG